MPIDRLLNRVFAGLLCLALALAPACRPEKTGGTPAASNPGTEATEERLAGLVLHGRGFPLRLVAADGTEALLERPAQRILATNAGLLDLLSALVPPERIIGMPRSAEAYSVSLQRGYGFDRTRLLDVLDSESVLGLDADLVLMRSWQSSEQRYQWQRAGLTVLSLSNPVSLREVQEDLLLLGRLCGASPAAEALNAELDRRAQALQASSAKRTSWRVLDYTNGGAGGWVAGRGTTFQLLCDLCGAINAGAEFDGHARCDLETLRRLDPDAFVLAIETGAPGETSTELYLRGEPRLTDLRAVLLESYCVLPAALSGTDTQFVMDAAESLAAWLDARPTPRD